MEPTHDLMDAVLEWSPQEVEAWLEARVICEPVEGQSFNWDVFALTTAARAGDERSLLWARIALRVYDGLVRHSPARRAHSYMLSAMNLRARMIGELGSRDGDAVLDPEPIAEWVLRHTTLPVDETVKMLISTDLQSIPHEKLLKLRDIKNALNVLAEVADTGVLQKHPELGKWLEIRTRLP